MRGLLRRAGPTLHTTAVVFIGLAAWTFFVPSPAAQTATVELVVQVERYAGLVVSTSGSPVADASFEVGNIAFSLREGVIFSVTDSAGSRAGILFVGTGAYRYVSVDPVDRQVVGRNLRKVGNLQLQDGFVVADTMDAALLLGTGPWPARLAALAGPAGSVVTAGDVDPSGPFEKLRSRLPESLAPLFAASQLNDLPGHSCFYAEIDGGTEPVAYELDRETEPTEGLWAREKEDGHWFYRWISGQVDPTVDIAQALVLRDLKLDVATQDNRSGRIDSVLTLEVVRDGLRYASFDLLSHRDPRGYYRLDGDHALEVRSITDGPGETRPFVHHHHCLVVDLGRPYRAGEQVVLEVQTQGEAFTGFGGTTYDRYFEFVGVSWYPEPVGWRSSGFTYEMRIETQKPFLPVVSGKTVSFREEGDSYFVESKRELPSKSPALLAGKYKVYEETFDGLPIKVYSYATQSEAHSEKIARLANGFIRYYEEFLGPYPFAELEIVEVPALGFGIAPSGVVLLTSEAYKPRSSTLTSLYTRGVNARLAHEIAHHWFAHKSMVSDPRDTWLSESFAEYVSGLAIAAIDPQGPRKIVGFEDMLVDWRALSDECENVASLLAAGQLAGTESGLHRFGLLYCRGPLLLHMLRTVVGDDQFLSMIRLFLDRAGMGVVTTADFRDAVRRVRGRDMGWFFEDWVSKPGIPTVVYDYRVERGPHGAWVVSGELRQEPEEFKTLVVPFLLKMRGGQEAVRVVFQNEPVKSFRFEVPEEPRQVTVDPNDNNLAKYKRL